MRGWFIAWAVLLATHCVLRLVQLYAGDYVLPEIFQVTIRPDHSFQWVLLLIMVPMLIQQDSPAGANFWKARPVKPSALLAEKILILVGYFVVLPLVLDSIYFGLAGFRGGDLMNAVGRWGLVRLLVVAVLATVACHSKSMGGFIVHLAIVLLIGVLSFIAILFLIKSIDPKFVPYWLFELHGFWQTFWLPSGLALVAATVILFLRYVKGKGGAVSVAIVAVVTVCYPVLCPSISYRVDHVNSQRMSLPENPASVVIHCKLNAARLFSTGSGEQSPARESSTRKFKTYPSPGPIQELMVQGLPQRQNRAVEFHGRMSSKSGPAEGIFFGSSDGIQQYSYRDEVEFNALNIIHLFSVSFQSSAEGATHRGIEIQLACTLREPTIAAKLNLGTENSTIYHKKFIDISQDSALRFPELRMQNRSSKWNPLVLNVEDDRWGINSGNASEMRLVEGAYLVGLREIGNGQIFPFSQNLRKNIEDMTRFHRSTSEILSYQSADEAKREEIDHRATKNLTNWEALIMVESELKEAVSLPIFLSPHDIQLATGQPIDLTLHFNPTTQRWETTSEP